MSNSRDRGRNRDKGQKKSSSDADAGITCIVIGTFGYFAMNWGWVGVIAASLIFMGLWYHYEDRKK